MKATFEFDLNDPDEKMEHFRHTKSLDMAICLFDIQQLLRNSEKYDWNLNSLQDAIRESFEAHGINTNELVR